MKGKRPLVLVVDDEPEALKCSATILQSSGYDTLAARDGAEAIRLFNDRPVDLVLLDLVLPRLDGFQVCKHLRSAGDVPIIVVSGLGRERDKVRALDLGADSYLTKPYGIEELLARVRAVLRRTGWSPAQTNGCYRIGDLEVDVPQRRVLRRGQPVKLTPIEFALLVFLIKNAGKIVTHRMILSSVWGGEYGDEKAYVWAYMRRLRSKLGDDPEAPTLIRTEAGVGYRFVAEVATMARNGDGHQYGVSSAPEGAGVSRGSLTEAAMKLPLPAIRLEGPDYASTAGRSR